MATAERVQSDIELDYEDGKPKEQRTFERQAKSDALVKQKKREEGEQTNRSRSASRRARRNRIQQGMKDGKYMMTTSLEALEEADANGELSMMGPFERIGPDSTSMDGPVTYARAMRGEIPVRGSNPNQPYYMPKKEFGKETGKSLDQDEGLKLTLEANLDVEIELKASIRGDLTLSLLYVPPPFLSFLSSLSTSSCLALLHPRSIPFLC